MMTKNFVREKIFDYLSILIYSRLDVIFTVLADVLRFTVPTEFWFKIMLPMTHMDIVSFLKMEEKRTTH